MQELIGKTVNRQPHPVDIHVGSRVKLKRNLLAVTQTTLASAIGVTFQQLQKYEHGVNRMSASRLWEISRVLKTPVQYFFKGMPATTTESGS